MAKFKSYNNEKRGKSLRLPRFFYIICYFSFLFRSLQYCLRYRIKQFYFLIRWAIQLFNILRNVFSVKFCHSSIKLCLLFRCFRIMYNNFHSQSPLSQNLFKYMWLRQINMMNLEKSVVKNNQSVFFSGRLRADKIQDFSHAKTHPSSSSVCRKMSALNSLFI